MVYNSHELLPCNGKVWLSWMSWNVEGLWQTWTEGGLIKWEDERDVLACFAMIHIHCQQLALNVDCQCWGCGRDRSQFLWCALPKRACPTGFQHDWFGVAKHLWSSHRPVCSRCLPCSAIASHDAETWSVSGISLMLTAAAGQQKWKKIHNAPVSKPPNQKCIEQSTRGGESQKQSIYCRSDLRLLLKSLHLWLSSCMFAWWMPVCLSVSRSVRHGICPPTDMCTNICEIMGVMQTLQGCGYGWSQWSYWDKPREQHRCVLDAAARRRYLDKPKISGSMPHGDICNNQCLRAIARPTCGMKSALADSKTENYRDWICVIVSCKPKGVHFFRQMCVYVWCCGVDQVKDDRLVLFTSSLQLSQTVFSRDPSGVAGRWFSCPVSAGKSHININKFGGIVREWVGVIWGHWIWGRKST